jgi:hypothetical protein
MAGFTKGGQSWPSKASGRSPALLVHGQRLVGGERRHNADEGEEVLELGPVDVPHQHGEGTGAWPELPSYNASVK